MALLKLLFFSTMYNILDYQNFIILILFSLIILISNKTKLEFNPNNFDPFMVFVNIINIISKLITLQINIIIMNMNKTYFGSYIIRAYNYLNSYYINIRSYPFKLLFGINNINIKPKLKDKKDINSFLDSL